MRTPVKLPTRPAKQYALWLLGQREWSAKELAARLKLKGYPAEEVDTCLAYCRQHALQSDTRYATSRTRVRAASRGNQRILQELAQKGIDQETAREAVAQAGDEQDRANHAASRFAGKEMTQQLQAKAWRFLMSRGFSSSAIKTALKALPAVEPLVDET